jgi:hypothetical protein
VKRCKSPTIGYQSGDRHTGDISASLTRFSNSDLKEYEAFVVDGRRVLAELQKVLKNIDERSSRLIFGH